MKSALIVGCGNIGIRHYEALVASHSFSSITILDVPQRINILRNDPLFSSSTSFATQGDPLLPFYDLIIIASSASIRRDLLDLYIDLSDTFILEKPLFPQKKSYNLSFIDKKLYVNTWYHLALDFTASVDNLIPPESIYVEGFRWNLCSNAIHYLNLFETFFDINFTNPLLSSTQLSSVYETKRPGYSDFFGSLAFTSPTTNLFLSDRRELLDGSPRSRKITFQYSDHSFVFHFDGHSITLPDGSVHKVPYMSDVFSRLYATYGQSNSINLPSYIISKRQHLLLLDALDALSLHPDNFKFT